MGIDLADHDGSFSQELSDFYSGIAAGGCGFLILSNATVSRDSILSPRGLRLYEAGHAEALKPFLGTCRDRGIVVGVQLQHYGGQAITTFVRGKPLLTPSAVASNGYRKRDPKYRVREMTIEDIDLVKDQFVRAARLSIDCGAQLIQLQASNGYLLSSFLSPNTNRRVDGYGGSKENRGRFLCEIVRDIRKEIGQEAILSVRLGVDDCIGAGGTVVTDFDTVVPLLEDAGVDLLEVSICTAETFKKLTDGEAGMEAHLHECVRQIKEYARVPVGFAGFVDSLQKAERLIEDGTADLVGMARAIFADNDLVNKTLDGREAQINKCLWDGRCFKDKANPRYSRVYCCVNPKYKRPE